MLKQSELLAPAGDYNKMMTAFHFGADAVYLGGESFSLRAGAKNFDLQNMCNAVRYAHSINKKVYVACNIFARSDDFAPLAEYLSEVERAGADAVIASDAGVIALIKKTTRLNVHLSTQANVTNKYAAQFWADNGVSRIVVARECSLSDIVQISDFIKGAAELEAFVHGAMCISYSGRCLLSNFLTARDGNRGECVQACRWEWDITERNKGGAPLTIGEDGRGTYLLNSKDLNMIEHLRELSDAGVASFKIEGRMKSQYYVASVTSAYRKAIDLFNAGETVLPSAITGELDKNTHRDYTTGFYYKNQNNVCLNTSQPRCGYEFIAEVKGYDAKKGMLTVEQRNRFKRGDVLEILSANGVYCNRTITAEEIFDSNGNAVEDCKLVQQILHIKTDAALTEYDILRREKRYGE